MTLPDLTFARPWAWWLLLLVPLVILAARWRPGRLRPGRFATALRGMVLVLLVVTLAGPLLVRGADDTTTIFVVDRSASIQAPAGEAANDWVMQALDAAGADDSAAIVTFGAEPDLAVPPVEVAAIGDEWLASGVPVEATGLASALSLARSLPVGENRRIVVLSDGAENAGNALEQADQATNDGVSIDVVPLAGVEPTELRIEQVSGPTSIWQGDPMPLLVSIGSGGGGEATIDLVVDGAVVSSETVTLSPGQTVYSLTTPALVPGFHAVEVRVSGTEGDRIPENNAGYLGVVVREQPAVLMVAPVGSDPTRLEQALTAQGAAVTVIPPEAVPVMASGLAAYDAIVLNNVSAWEMADAQQQAVITHTQQGNGLIVIGGAAAFGPGSYAGTDLEQAMPVTVKVVDGQQRPTVAVLIIMDKSGSMSYDPADGDVSKIDLAKNGVVTAASALAPGDQLGVIAFNDEPIWALPMMTITGSGDLGRVEDALSALAADGGTELYPALQVGYDAMRNVQADVRHIILLSDGKSRSGTDETYERLLSDLGNDNITLSTVALGTDADIELLQSLAVEGNGRYHFASTPDQIPAITFQEAQSAGSQSVLRGTFSPVQTQPSPILNGIEIAAMPQIDGYNFAEGRNAAQVDLVSDRGDPLLAKWQLGLGRVVAWTADDGSDYASAWAQWDQYDQFWGQALRWTLPDPTNQAVTADLVRDGNDVTLAVESAATGGDSVNLQGQTVTVTAPDGSTQDVALAIVAPGEYAAALPDPQAGAYALAISGQERQLAAAVQTSPEWLPAADGLSLLEAIASRTGGMVLSLDAAPGASLFDSQGQNAHAPGTVTPVWQYPLIVALSLFVIEIALRLFDGRSLARNPSRSIP